MIDEVIFCFEQDSRCAATILSSPAATKTLPRVVSANILSGSTKIATKSRKNVIKTKGGSYKKHFLTEIFGSVSYRAPSIFPKNSVYIGVIFKVAKI